MTTATVPTLHLNNVVELPALGLGVFQSPPEETVGAVEAAIANGHGLIDTAAAYGNEREVGKGIRRSGVDRGEMFALAGAAGRAECSPPAATSSTTPSGLEHFIPLLTRS
jgi:diketogulonate reductase-like aldo/keto reductase